MPRARNRLGTLAGRIKGLFALRISPDALASLFLLVVVLIVPGKLYFSMVQKNAKKKKKCRVKGLSQETLCTFCTSPQPLPL